MVSKTDPHKNDARQGVSLRSMVSGMAAIDPDGAYDIAKSIKHPWYRSQSLAMVAENSGARFFNKILHESFLSAMECHDENRRVEVACWPLTVAIKHGRLDLAEEFLKKCISEIDKDVDPISRWCAVSVLIAIKKDTSLLSVFFETFRNATNKGHGWRVERMIKYLINDVDIQKDHRYLEHLLFRKAQIESWKKSYLESNQLTLRSRGHAKARPSTPR